MQRRCLGAMHSGQWRGILRGRHVNHSALKSTCSQTNLSLGLRLRQTCATIEAEARDRHACLHYDARQMRGVRPCVLPVASGKGPGHGGAKVESPTTCRVGMGHPLPGCWALGATAPSCSRVPLSWGSFGNGADREIERGVVVVLGSSRRWGLAPLDGAVRFGWRRRSVGMVV
jgi:hypothetical protein